MRTNTSTRITVLVCYHQSLNLFIGRSRLRRKCKSNKKVLRKYKKKRKKKKKKRELRVLLVIVDLDTSINSWQIMKSILYPRIMLTMNISSPVKNYS